MSATHCGHHQHHDYQHRDYQHRDHQDCGEQHCDHQHCDHQDCGEQHCDAQNRQFWPVAAALTMLALDRGRLVVAKRRAGPAGRTATEAEARWLAAARHPGVVALSRVLLDEGQLETGHAGLATLRTTDPGPQVTAEILALVATTVAQLHRQGLVHGNLAPEHVVLSGPHRRRPRLCSPGVRVPGGVTNPAWPVRREPTVDQSGLAGLASFAAGRVASRRSRSRWEALADALAHDPGLTPARAVNRFEALRSSS